VMPCPRLGLYLRKTLLPTNRRAPGGGALEAAGAGAARGGGGEEGMQYLLGAGGPGRGEIGGEGDGDVVRI